MIYFHRLTLSALRVVGLLAALGCSAVAEDLNEYAVKASFLCKFVEFVKWPSAATPAKGAPVSLGVLGDDPFGGELDRISKQKEASRVRFAVKRSRRVEDLRGCQIVFVSQSEKARTAEIIAGFAGSNVLVVGESEGFARAGGVLGFTVKSGTVGFEVNRGAADRAGLVISSRLLKLASMVGDRSSELKP